jgi:secretion/DNA translocation related TadE-like protein
VSRHQAGADTGSGVVLVLALAAVFLGLVMVIVAVGGASAIRHRADAAADLAALAAAAAGPVTGCQRAAVVAEASGASLLGCHQLPDGSVVVETGMDLPGWLGGLAAGHRPAGRARAGRVPEPVALAGCLGCAVAGQMQT